MGVGHVVVAGPNWEWLYMRKAYPSRYSKQKAMVNSLVSASSTNDGESPLEEGEGRGATRASVLLYRINQQLSLLRDSEQRGRGL